jgi:exodeoxyribonuclease VIII
LKPGIYEGLSNADYHGGPGVSKSILDLVRRSPAHAKSAKDTPPSERKTTPAQAIGTAFHALVLEPKLFVSEFCLGMSTADYPHAIDSRDALLALVDKLNATRQEKLTVSGSKGEQIERILSVQTDLDAGTLVTRDQLESMKGAELKQILEDLNRTREGKLSTSGLSMQAMAAVLRAHGQDVVLLDDLRAEWLKNNGHRTIVEREEWTDIHAMRDAAMAHKAAGFFLRKPGRAEVSIYWTDEVTGLLCRCRPDFWTDDNIVVDLKTTEDASPDEFARSVAKWRYHVQDPFYRDGITAATGKLPRAFVFIATEKSKPHATAVYALTAQDIELGRMEYRKDLNAYAEAMRTDTWPAYAEDVQPLSVPGWYLNSRMQALAA